MSGKTLKFDDNVVNNKWFHKSKKPNKLNLINVDQVVISDKFKHGHDGFKYFTDYKEDETVKPLSIILSQINGYIKSFKNGGKIKTFLRN